MDNSYMDEFYVKNKVIVSNESNNNKRLKKNEVALDEKADILNTQSDINKKSKKLRKGKSSYRLEMVYQKPLITVNKTNMIILIVLSLLIGIVIGCVYGQLKHSRIYESKLEQITLEARASEYTALKTAEHEIAKNNSHMDKITHAESTINRQNKELEALQSEIEIKNKQIESLKEVNELFDEYEYILMHGGQRTDITISQLNHGIHEMESRGLNPHLMFGKYKLESAGREDATHPNSTARGYGQFIESTGRWVYENPQFLNNGENTYNHDKAFCGYTNMSMTAAYIDWLIQRANGNIYEALIAYNGNEIGDLYYNIINRHLMEGPGITLDDIQQEYYAKNM